MFIPFVSQRYLFSHKKHNTINFITWVSVSGVAVGTMALIIVMSVLNGFEKVITSTFSEFDPELRITANEGNHLESNSKLIKEAKSCTNHSVWCEIIEQDGLLGYINKQTPARIKGVSDNYANISNIDSLLWDGTIDFSGEGGNSGAIGIGLSSKLGTGVDKVNPITLYAPKKRKVNLSRPDANFSQIAFYTSAIFSVQQPKYDEQLVILPIDLVRKAYQLDSNWISSIELRITPIGQPSDNAKIATAKKALSKILGEQYKIEDRYEQQTDFYKITKIEKWTTFMILSFILLIATFNIIGSLSMIVIEKREDITLFSALGATHQQIRRLFTFEGFSISAIGSIAGIILGITIVIIQDHFKIIKIGEGFITEAYPVELQLLDIILVMTIVFTMGYIASLYTASSQMKQQRKQIE